MYKISVIVPIYNTAAYIEKCIKSITNQILKDIEIILVNDGSEDNSLALCKKHAALDKRIVIIDKENGGVASARNAGLDVATGDYIGFVDSDDYIAPNMYSVLLDAIVKSGADIAECGYYTVDIDGRIIRKHPLQDALTVSHTQCSHEYITRENTTNFNCNKLYSRSLFEGIRYAALTSSEDFYINVQTFYNCRKKVTVRDCYYYYYANMEGVCLRPFTISRLDAVEAGKKACAFYQERLAELVPYAALFTLRYIMRFYYESTCLNEQDRRLCRQSLIKAFKTHYPLTRSRALAIKKYRKQRLLMQLFQLNPYAYCAIYRRWKKQKDKEI